MNSFIPRVTPFGIDDEGRVYLALTPGVHEREDALQFLQDSASDKSKKTSRTKTKRRSNAADEKQRGMMSNWSLFVAVWGKRPTPSEKVIIKEADHSDESDDEAELGEEWFTFSNPQEIENLAKQIEIRSCLDDEVPSGRDETRPGREGTFSEGDNEIMATRPYGKEDLKSLVRNLKDYAALLNWRFHGDQAIDIDGDELK
jgi:hypothetical protein